MLNAFGYRFGWDPWEYEEWQRHAILRGAGGIGDEDILVLADVDEVMSRGYIDAVRKCEPFPKIREGGRAIQENCQVMTASIVSFQYHFGCLRPNGEGVISHNLRPCLTDFPFVFYFSALPPRLHIGDMPKGWRD